MRVRFPAAAVLLVAAVSGASWSTPSAALASSSVRPSGMPSCPPPTKQNQAHVTLPSSSAFLDHGVTGTLLNVTGHILAVLAGNGTIATVYDRGDLAGLRPGERVAAHGVMRQGLIYASAVRAAGGTPWPARTTPVQPIGAIRHVIFIVQENHSFDNYFGAYPGVRGLKAGIRLPQSPFSGREVAPFPLRGPINRDLAHTWAAAHLAYDRGRMNGFVYSDGTRLAMGYYTGRTIPNYWAYAAHFTLNDMFFAPVMGPSLPNHLYTVAGSSGGYIWNMWEPPTPCAFHFPTVPGQFQAAGIGWRYYSGMNPQKFWLWNPLPGFRAFQRSAALRSHLAPSVRFFQDLRRGTLPTFSWITPNKIESEHAPANNQLGMWYVTDLLNAVGQSRYWNDTAVVVTWDEYGGWYDGVLPPKESPFGFGFRVPALVISPYARSGYVNSRLLSFNSVLRYEEQLKGLAPVSPSVGVSNSIASDLNMARKPLRPFLITAPLPSSAVPKPTLP